MASIETATTKSGERRYVVRYRDRLEGRKRSGTDRKVDAKRFADGIETDKNRGEYIDRMLDGNGLSEVADRWLATRARQGTLNPGPRSSHIWNSMILPTFGNRTVKSITPSDNRSLASGTRPCPEYARQGPPDPSEPLLDPSPTRSSHFAGTPPPT